MTKHPEQLPGEIFLGNKPVDRLPYPGQEGIKTLRTGRQAYDIHGKKLPGYEPIFIGVADEGDYYRCQMDSLSEAYKALTNKDDLKGADHA